MNDKSYSDPLWAAVHVDAAGDEVPQSVTGSGGSTGLMINAVFPNAIAGTYDTISGNQPNTYANTLFLWQNTNAIPYNQAPLASFSVPGNTQMGSFAFSGISVQAWPYIIGYAVGPNPAQICSTAYIPATGSAYVYFQTSLDISVLPDSVIISYATPANNTPQTNGNWVGIWESSIPPFSGAPVAQAPVALNTSVGQVVLNNLTLKRGTTYTAAYFMTANKQTSMAAYLTFNT